jgi:hypothetical protein
MLTSLSILSMTLKNKTLSMHCHYSDCHQSQCCMFIAMLIIAMLSNIAPYAFFFYQLYNYSNDTQTLHIFQLY